MNSYDIFQRFRKIAPSITLRDGGYLQPITPWTEESEHNPSVIQDESVQLKNLPYKKGRYCTIMYFNDSMTGESLGLKCISVLAVIDSETDEFFLMEIFDHNHNDPKRNQKELFDKFLPLLHPNGKIRYPK